MRINNFKLFENVQQSKSLLRRWNVGETDETFLKIRNLLKDNSGYLGFFVKMWLDQDVSFDSLREFFETINQPYINFLKKDIISYTSWEELMEDVLKAKSEWKYKHIFNEFPALQKELIDEVTKPLLINLYDRKDKENYLKKIARYKTTTELNNSLKTFLNSDSDIRFKSILKLVKSSRAELIYSKEMEDIIIVKVDDSYQLRSIAGDSSWCILSQSTFDSYNSGLYRQFVIFLTDKDDNYRKIGVTYGRRMKTAHLLDDRSISFDKLTKILTDRGFNIDRLKIPLDKIDFSKASLEDLIEAGFTKEDLLLKKTNLSEERVYLLKKLGLTIDEVLTLKKSFNKQELSRDFTPEEVEKYNLNDKIELYDESDLKDKSLAWIVDNIYRIKLGYQDRRNRDSGKLDLEFLTDLNPTPREIKMLMGVNKDDLQRNFSDDCLELLKEIDKPINDISFWRFDKNSVDTKIYILRYKGVGPQNLEWDKFLKIFRDESITHIDKILEFLKINGWEVTTEKLIELIQALKFGSYYRSNPLDNWLDLLSDFPQLKKHVDKIVSYCLKKDTRVSSSSREDYEDYRNFLSQNKISHVSFTEVHSKNLANYPELKRLSEKQELLKFYREVLPKHGTMNYDNRNIAIQVKKIDRSYSDISPEIIVDYFFPKIKKDLKNNFQSYSNSSGINVIYMMVSLVKTGNIDKLEELELSFRQNGMKMLIRILFDLEKYNGTSYLRKDFQLTDSEREKLCEWLVQHRSIIRSNYSNEVITNMEMYQQSALSLIYYYYDWGFPTYFNLVKKFKRQKDEWVKIDGADHHQTGITRIDLFEEVFNYQFIKNDKAGYEELVEKIKSNMVLKQFEIKQLEVAYRRDHMSTSDL